MTYYCKHNAFSQLSKFLFSDARIGLISPIYRLAAMTTVFIALTTAFIAAATVFIIYEDGRRGDKDGHPGKKLCTSRKEAPRKLLA